MKRTLASLFCFSLIAAMGSYWSHSTNKQVALDQRNLIAQIVTAQVTNFERRLTRSLSGAEMLAIELEQHQGKIEQFDTFAQSVIDSIGGISNLQLAPNGVIEAIYPLKGNEAAIGHNILRDDLRKKEAWLAIEKRQLTLAGPFPLIQGGVGLVGRKPVFLKQGGEERFWGFASALIHLDELLTITGLNQLGDDEYAYQITRTHPDTQQPEIIVKSKLPVGAIYHTAEINVPNAVWTFELSHEIALPYQGLLGYAASLLTAALVAWIVWSTLHYPLKLEQLVKNKTLELETLAFDDHLTGLANRRSLTNRLERLLLDIRRYQYPAVLMYLDLDDFKRINDSMGHDAGDLLLQKIASRLRDVVRESDFVARLGGDEFAVLLLGDTSVNSASRIAEKLIAAIEQPVCIQDRCFNVTTSIGITIIPADGDRVSTLLSRADLAMYAAKHAGKRSYHFFDQQMQDQAVDKHQLEIDLVEAVAKHQFELHYQPLIELKSGRVSGYEALLRWHHPTRGFMPPDQFIPLAEESGKIVEVGYWVIGTVCQLISQQMQTHQSVNPIAVNLSPKQFNDPGLLEKIRRIVSDAGIDARLLEVEITESTLMGNVDEAIDIMKQLREMGIRIAIDDFGTGYSSLAVLQRFPVDKLKIDRSFVTKMSDERSDQKIVRTIIAMAHTLGIEVVAEGIEELAQFEILKNAKCDIGQGYLFSRPEPAEKAFGTSTIALLETNAAMSAKKI